MSERRFVVDIRWVIRAHNESDAVALNQAIANVVAEFMQRSDHGGALNINVLEEVPPGTAPATPPAANGGPNPNSN